MGALEDKIALVTGAGSGIGAAIATRFAWEGARVFVADRDAVGGNAVAERLRKTGAEAEFVSLDITDENACTAVVASILKTAKRIDVLVNNAGIGKVGTILQTTSEEFDMMWNVNVKGMFYLCRAVLPGMLERKKGSIVNMGSIASQIGMYDRFSYVTTKHAVSGLTRSMATDFATSGVRVNCICPGRVETPFVQARLSEYPDPERFRKEMEAPHLMKRMAQPEEIAAAALFLASDDSSFVTGIELDVDGGYTAGK